MAWASVPDPAKKSSTRSPGWVAKRKMRSINCKGLGVENTSSLRSFGQYLVELLSSRPACVPRRRKSHRVCGTTPCFDFREEALQALECCCPSLPPTTPGLSASSSSNLRRETRQ